MKNYLQASLLNNTIFALLTVFMFNSAIYSNTTSASPLTKAIAHPGRTAEDLERDKRSKPKEVLKLLKLKRKQTVVDIFTGGGYYSELLAYAVGEKGKVYAHNNYGYRQYVGEQIEKRVAARDLKQIEIYDREIADLDLAKKSIDAVIMVMSFHDMFLPESVDAEGKGWPKMDVEKFLAHIKAALKRNGKVLIIDHAAPAETKAETANTLHRIDEEYVKAIFAKAGFKLSKESDALRNPQDPKTISVFDPAVQGKTDRFVLMFKKAKVKSTLY